MCKSAYCFFRNQPKCLGQVTGQVEKTCTAIFFNLLNKGALHTFVVHTTLLRIFLSKAICVFSASAFLFSAIESFNNFQYSL